MISQVVGLKDVEDYGLKDWGWKTPVNENQVQFFTIQLQIVSLITIFNALLQSLIFHGTHAWYSMITPSEMTPGGSLLIMIKIIITYYYNYVSEIT